MLYSAYKNLIKQIEKHDVITAINLKSDLDDAFEALNEWNRRSIEERRFATLVRNHGLRRKNKVHWYACDIKTHLDGKYCMQHSQVVENINLNTQYSIG